MISGLQRFKVILRLYINFPYCFVNPYLDFAKIYAKQRFRTVIFRYKSQCCLSRTFFPYLFLKKCRLICLIMSNRKSEVCIEKVKHISSQCWLKNTIGHIICKMLKSVDITQWENLFYYNKVISNSAWLVKMLNRSKKCGKVWRYPF